MSSIVCVNADSREFKSLLAKTNFSVGTLKSIIHEYQNNPFLQEAGQYWPSDTYVMSYFTKSYAGSPLQASVWSKKYSAPHVYSTYQEAKAAKAEAQTWFNEDDIYIYENGQGNWVLRVARPIDTKSANAHSKERLIELQNTVDNLINSGVSGRYIKTGNKILDKKNQAAMNTLGKILDNFYRRYGLKVRAYWSPSAKKWKVEYAEEEKKFLDDIDDINASVFTWNEGQKNAIETVVDFLNDRNAGQMIRINGKAGTGKTTIINEILSRYDRKGVEGGKPVVLIGALAHKAKHVLDIKVSKENKAKYRIVPKSIAGMLGLREARKRFDKNGNPSNDEHDKFYDTFTSSKEEMLDGGVPISQADIVIIDEASMVSEEYWDMIKAAKKSHTKFIFLGDKGQLPPIRSENDVYYGLQHKELLGSEADSPVWTDDMPEVTLTERVRQGEDNPLHQITDMYWNFSQGLSTSTLPLSSFALDENDLRVIMQGHADIASQSLDLFREAIATQNPNLVKIVTPTNPQVAAYNEQVHFSLHPELTGLAKAEAIMPVKGEIVTMYKNLYAYDPRLKQQVLVMANGDDGIVVDRSPYTTSDEYGVQHVVYFIKKDDGNTVEIPVLLDTPENRTLYNRIVTTLKWDSDNKYGTPAGRQAYAKYMGYKNKYGDLRLGYATTVHKSQGSTYEVAFVNTDGVFGSKRAQAQMMYTALTRASNMTIISGVGSRAALPSSTIQQANTTIRNNRGKVATPSTATPTSAPPASAPKTTRQYGLSAEQIAAIHAETDDLTKIIKDALVTTQKARLETLPDVTTPLNQMRVGTILDADQVLTMVALDPTATAEQKALAKTLIPLFKKMNIRVRFDEADQGTAGTTYSVRQEGGYDVRVGLNTLKSQKTPSQTVLHELVHSLSVNRLREDTKFRTGVIELMDYVRNFLKERGVPEGAWYNKRGEDFFVARDTYGVHNEREFFAEAMANPRFQTLLKAIPAPKENLTVWQKFCKLIADTFRNLLNIEYKQDSNVYDILIPVIADTLTVTANQGDRTAPFAEWNMERTATMQAMSAEIVKALNVAITEKDVHWTTEQKPAQQKTVADIVNDYIKKHIFNKDITYVVNSSTMSDEDLVRWYKSLGEEYSLEKNKPVTASEIRKHLAKDKTRAYHIRKNGVTEAIVIDSAYSTVDTVETTLTHENIHSIIATMINKNYGYDINKILKEFWDNNSADKQSQLNLKLIYGIDENNLYNEYFTYKAAEAITSGNITPITSKLSAEGLRFFNSLLWELQFISLEQRKANEKSGKVELDSKANTQSKNGINKEITSQSIQQLQAILTPMGNKVHGLADMQKYFQEHYNAFDKIQQAIEGGEMSDIKAKAIANGTFMKAPNGKPTNLNERQWLQVRTKAFKDWFGDWINDPENASKVVDENGEPLVVYHFTDDTFTTFKDSINGLHFTPDSTGKNIFDPNPNTKKVSMPVFLNIKDPGYEWGKKYWINKEDWNRVWPYQRERLDRNSSAAQVLKIREEANLKFPSVERILGGEGSALQTLKQLKPSVDGVIRDQGDFIVYNPNQIKSATANNGMFSTENADIQMFTTPDGEVYGFVAPNGDIYLDETKISPEHPIHEYTHLWDRIVAKKNPKLWKRGVELMKQTSIWKQIADDVNYGLKWGVMVDFGELSQSQYESLIASEVHARFVGEDGQQLLDNLAKEKSAKGIISKLKQWILDFWKNLKATFSNFSDDEIQKLTLDDFNHMPVRDFADAVNFVEAPSFSEAPTSSPSTGGSKPMSTAKAIERANGFIGELNSSPYKKEGNRFVLKTGTPVLDALKTITDRGHNPGTWSYGDPYDGQVSYNIGYSNGQKSVLSATNRDLYDEGWRPTHIMIRREKDRLNQDLDWSTTNNIDQFNDSTFLVNAEDKKLIEYLDQKGYKYELYSDAAVQPTSVDPSLFHLVSGKADGSDKTWAAAARAAGMNVRDYTVEDWDNLDAESKARYEKYYQDICMQIGRKPLNADSYKGKLVRRDLLQADNADAVFAVGSWENSIPNGGTAYAFMRAFNTGKPIYFFNQDENQWYKSDYEKRQFIAVGVPKLTPAAAVIGTRGDKHTEGTRTIYILRENAKQAIQGVIDNTLGKPVTAPVPNVRVQKPAPNIRKVKPFVLEAIDAANKQYKLRRTEVTDATPEEIKSSLDLMFDTGEVPFGVHIIAEGLTKAEIEAISSAECMNKVAIDTRNRKDIAEWTTGYTAEEIALKKQENALLNSTLFGNKELRDLSALTMFKLSEQITKLQTGEESAESILGPDFANSDFEGMSRIEIINAIGLNRLFNEVIKERIFNYNLNPNLKKNRKLMKKAQQIRDNFDAFIRMGYDSLIEKEHIAPNGITRGITADADRSITSEEGEALTDEEIQEIFGSTLESWQTGFRQTSAFTNLTKLIRERLDRLYELDAEGNIVTQEFGIEKNIDSHEAVTKLLKWTQGATDIFDMINKIKAKESENPWVSQLLDILNDDNEEQFRSQFYSNFKKYFQPYHVIFKHKNRKTGEVTTKIKLVNSDTFVQSTLNTIASLDNTGKLNIYNGNTHQFNLQALGVLAGARDTIQADLGHMTPVGVNTVIEAFKVLNIPAPSHEEMARLLSDTNVALSIRKSLSYLYSRFNKDSKKVQDKEYRLLREETRSDYQSLINTIAATKSEGLESVSYEAGKMHYSFVTPSWLSAWVESMKGMHGNVEDFINEKYGKIHGWFFNPTDTAHPDQKGPDGWLNYWLAELMDDTQEADRLREIFDHTVVLSDDGVAYQDKSPMQYIASLFEMFSYDVQKKSAWYRIPMMSNKTSEEYLKFARITGDYKKVILDWLCDKTFYQEVNRIRAVNYRKAHLSKVNQIAEFDKNGSQFHFLHMLNRFIGANSDFGKLLTKVINGEELHEAEGETTRFRENLRIVVESAIDGRFKAFMTTLRNEGVYSIDPESGTITPNILQDKLDKENFRDEMEEFFWNDMFASINILQLTVVDPAQYKNTEDLQKRLAQLHSPGVRADVTATINGRQVTDATIKDGKVTGGNTRTIYIADDKVRSEIVPCLEVIKTNILSQSRYQNNPTAYKIMEQQLNFIIDEFKKVNVTDAQAYTSPTGYRKKMAVFGKWTPKDEELYQKILAGEFNELDLATAWQPLKPFVYTTINKDGKNPYIPTIQIGVQNKNSEYCLIMADALMRSQGMKTKLNVLFDFMERSHGLTKNDKGAWVGEPNTVGIDTIQFDSTVKVGKTGVFEINDIKDDEGNPIQAYTYNDIARLLTSRAWRDSSGNYDDLWVHTIPFNDYAIQQENPIHFLEHEQQQGSQGRILIWADMPDLNENKEPNMITVDGKTITVAEAKAQYFSAIADNIEESKQSIIERFGLTSSNRKIRNVYLSRILQQEILKDSRYGTDLYWACGLNESGEFNIPLSDPIQSERIQQLLNSIIKNTINKQMIAGGPVVQVSCYGYSEDLSIRFKDKDGNMLQSLSEYRKGMQENWQLQHHTEPLPEEQVIAQYKQYLKANHGSIAYYECYAPIYDRSLLKDFMDAEGNIDMQAIENAKDKNGNSIADKLLQMVGYRIPTEAKYSMVPIRIKGFLPRAAGEGIMLPKEITALSGSDFDIDKLYIMRYQLDRESNDEEIVNFLTDKYYSDMKEIGAEMFQGEIGRVRKHIIDIINGEIEPETYQEKAIFYYWQAHRKVTYSYPTEGKFYRDNLIVATHWAVLTSKQAEDQVLSCGNFEELKRVGYMIAAMDNHQGSYKDLSGVSSDGLKKLAYTDKYLQYADVQMQFHKQNMVAGKLIGVFAQSNVSHAFMNTLGGLKLNMPKGFTMRINGQEIKENFDFIMDNEYANDGATRISSILAQLLAASVDAVKDPVLGNLNISMDTVNVATTLVRMGHSLEYVGWFLTHPIIKQLITRYNNEIATGNKTNVGRVLVDMQQELVKASGNDEIKFPEDFNFSQDFFVEEHNRTEDNYVNDWSVLELYKKVSCIADTLRDVMLMTRFNSISSAVGPFASDTMDNKIKVQGFQSNKMISDESRKAIQQQPILKGFREASTDLEYQLLGRNIIQASGVAYSAYEELRNRMGYMSKQMAREFNKFFISYYVNMGDNPVFDLSDEHRKYVLENFPREFMKLKDDYDDNFFVQNVRLDKDSSGRDILTISTRGMTDTMLQDLRSAWADLYEDNKENAFSDKDNLAVRLVEYCFFVGSFGFSPKSFINLTPNVVRRAIPNYMENCSGINGMSNDQKNRLVLQFMLNMGYADLGTVQNKDIKYYDGNQVSSDSFPRMAGKHDGLARINMGGNEIKWYYVQEIPQSNNYKYTEVEKLGGNNQEAFEINPALDITKMHTAVEYPAPEQPKSGDEGNTPKPQTIDSRMFESIANALGTLNPLDGKGSLIETQKKFNELYEDNSTSLEGTLGLSKEVIDKMHKVFDVSPAELVANAADTINALALCAGV